MNQYVMVEENFGPLFIASVVVESVLNIVAVAANAYFIYLLRKCVFHQNLRIIMVSHFLKRLSYSAHLSYC